MSTDTLQPKLLNILKAGGVTTPGTEWWYVLCHGGTVTAAVASLPSRCRGSAMSASPCARQRALCTMTPVPKT